MTGQRVTTHSSATKLRLRGRAIRLCMAVLSALCLGACGSTKIGLANARPATAYRHSNETALAGRVLGIDTQTTLRRKSLTELCELDLAGCIRALHQETVTKSVISDELFALAELSLLHADELVRIANTKPFTTAATKARHTQRRPGSPQRDPILRDARAHYLAAALYAGAFLFPIEHEERVKPLDPRTRQAADIYARALAGAFAGDEHGEILLAAGRHALPFGHIQVAFDRTELQWGRRELDEVRWVGATQIQGLNNRYREAGLGTPIIAKTRLAEDDFDFVSASAWVPGTVLLRVPYVRNQLRGVALTGRLEVHTAEESRTIAVDDRVYPLEFDPSAALAASLHQSRYWESELARFLGRAIGVKRTTHLHAYEPYVTGKIPAVFVHGTDSSPATWANMVNDLKRDPRIRDKYHFWFFEYESGNSILYSEMSLRRALSEAFNRFQEAGGGDCMENMIVLGHSQGGLLTKLTAVASGNAFWDTYFNKPFAEIPMKAKMRKLLGEMTFFEPLPFVRRVVFLATPHRGSFLASPQIVRRLAARLIQLPREIVALGAERTLLLDRYTRPESRIGRTTTSIDNMSPSDAFIRASSRLQIAPDVPAHSIIALKPGQTKESGSDGVVKYSSAHIEGVDSEVIVSSGHSLLSQPAAVEEVRRILLLHADETSCSFDRRREIEYPGWTHRPSELEGISE